MTGSALIEVRDRVRRIGRRVGRHASHRFDHVPLFAIEPIVELLRRRPHRFRSPIERGEIDA